MDYLDWRGDISLEYKPFNAVDNLILSDLAYINMKEIVSSDFEFELSLPALLGNYRIAGLDQEGGSDDPLILLEKAAACDRFKNIRIGGYVNFFDKENVMQMSAVTFKLDDDTIYVAFRGTDKTLVGWREDFNFGFLEETPGQREAVKYLERAISETGCNAYVGGHSKGGNFAVYASAFAPDHIKQHKLLRVFSNDGPGFKMSIINSQKYSSILDKIVKIVPEGSIIGMLLFGKEKMRIIKSLGKGLDQHNPFNWQITRDSFLPAEDLTYSSVVMDVAFDRWVEKLDDDQRGIFISSLFDSIEAAGFTTLPELMANKFAAYNAISKAAKKLDEKNRKIVSDSLKLLASISKDVLWDDAKKKFFKK